MSTIYDNDDTQEEIAPWPFPIGDNSIPPWPPEISDMRHHAKPVM